MKAAGMRPPRPVDWAAAGAAGAAEDGQMGTASAEAAMTAAGGAAEDGPGAPPAITHRQAAEVLYEGVECDVDMGNAAEAPVAGGLIENRKLAPQMTRRPNKQNKAPLMCLSGQPAPKVRLAASSKQQAGREWMGVGRERCSNSRGCVGRAHVRGRG